MSGDLHDGCCRPPPAPHMHLPHFLASTKLNPHYHMLRCLYKTFRFWSSPCVTIHWYHDIISDRAERHCFRLGQ